VEVRGRVQDEAGRPLAGATVTLSAIGYTVRTDSMGAFRLSGTPGGTLSLSITAGGYRADTATLVLPRSGMLTRDFTLVSSDSPPPVANPSDRVLSGRVTNTEGTSLAYANIRLNGGRVFVSDDSGRFTIPVNVSGGLRLLVRRIGFAPAEVKLPGMPDTAVTVALTAVATALPLTQVTARSPFASLDIHGFYRRMEDVLKRGINRGYFVTPEDLELRKTTLTTSVVEQFPNIRVRQKPPARQLLSNGKFADRQGQFGGVPSPWDLRIEDGTGCPLTVYLDRVRVSPNYRRGWVQDDQLNLLVQPSSLAGAEIYPTTLGAPPEFSLMPGTCGVVLLWTR
jgi:hypothetical protein